MSTLLYGITAIGEFLYPYCFNSETEKITVYTGINSTKIPGETNSIIGQRLGMLAGGFTFYKLNAPISNDVPADQVRFLDFLIEDYHENSKYTEMRFRFPELDYFMPSGMMAADEEKQFVFSKAIDTICNFEIQFCSSSISISFNIKSEMNKSFKSVAQTISELSIKFPETDNMDYILDLYSSVRAFFVFICNRQNIGLRSAALIGKYPRKTIRDNKVIDTVSFSKQELVLSQKYLEPLEEENIITKTPEIGLFSPRFKELFQMFFKEKAGDDVVVDGSSIHLSNKYKNLIDLNQSLHITATFEYYVRTLLPEISSQNTIDFYKDIENLIDEYIEKVTGPKKKRAKDLKKLLKPQLSLRDKIIKAYNGYSKNGCPSWEPLKPILSEWFGENIEELAQVANSWRNELAHEKREYEPDKSVIAAIRLIEHINYCIVLRFAGYDDKQIKVILSEILAKPI